jgi:hypothetical protein
VQNSSVKKEWIYAGYYNIGSSNPKKPLAAVIISNKLKFFETKKKQEGC